MTKKRRRWEEKKGGKKTRAGTGDRKKKGSQTRRGKERRVRLGYFLFVFLVRGSGVSSSIGVDRYTRIE